MDLKSDQTVVQNCLLSQLSPGDLALLSPQLTRKSLRSGEILITAGQPITSVYFPDSGVVSFVGDGVASGETWIVGKEGFVGAPIVLDVDRLPLHARGQMTGEGHSLPSTAFLEALESSPTLRAATTRYTHVLMMQAASTAHANASFTVEQRLARWLLMYHDRTEGDDLPLTHELLAALLNVRRPGITVATHLLEGVGAIRATRGLVTIRDRAKLKTIAGDSYGLAEAEYERVLGPTFQSGELRKAA